MIITSLLMLPPLGHSPSSWITHKENVPQPATRAKCGLVCTSTYAAGTIGLTCLANLRGARNNTFLVTHSITDFCDVALLMRSHSERTDHEAFELLFKLIGAYPLHHIEVFVQNTKHKTLHSLFNLSFYLNKILGI
jgi:hypothetical protein